MTTSSNDDFEEVSPPQILSFSLLCFSHTFVTDSILFIVTPSSFLFHPHHSVTSSLVGMNFSKRTNPLQVICHVIIFIICAIVVSECLRTPSIHHRESNFSNTNLNKLSHATNISVEEIVSIEEASKLLEPKDVIKNIVSNVTKTWSSITQSYVSNFDDSSSKHSSSSKNSSSSVEEKWIKSSNIINELINSVIKSSLPLMLDLAYTSNLSPKCSSSLLQILSGIRSNRAWALSCKSFHSTSHLSRSISLSLSLFKFSQPVFNTSNHISFHFLVCDFVLDQFLQEENLSSRMSFLTLSL